MCHRSRRGTKEVLPRKGGRVGRVERGLESSGGAKLECESPGANDLPKGSWVGLENDKDCLNDDPPSVGLALPLLLPGEGGARAPLRLLGLVGMVHGPVV